MLLKCSKAERNVWFDLLYLEELLARKKLGLFSSQHSWNPLEISKLLLETKLKALEVFKGMRC